MEDLKIKSFLEIPYGELEEMNLKAKKKAQEGSEQELQEEYLAYLAKEKRIKAVVIAFSDIEGRFHMLDYDKKQIIKAQNNLTSDGSSVRGFSEQKESDLRLKIDWSSFRWLPADVFGAGKVLLFANILNRDFTQHESDFRGRLKEHTQQLKEKEGLMINVSPEIEGFLVNGKNAEQHYTEDMGFDLISSSGYYHSLPLGILKQFIDRAAEAQRAMGFGNEKDHPEVAPAQFELNFSYTDALSACDQIQLYKIICRQIADNMGMTATFLPKPTSNINGSGMHMNFSVSRKGKNMFYDAKGKDGLSSYAWNYIQRLLNHAPELCMVLNSSVNAYRRLDPHFEAPNQIMVSAIDRGAMIRIPIADEKSARIEIRSVAPDANPYCILYSVLKTGREGKPLQKNAKARDRVRFLPDNLYTAIRLFKARNFMTEIFGEDAKEKYILRKQFVADRSPKELGKHVKRSEIVYHHEVTNQILWNDF